MSPGTTGATSTRTGMPASASLRTASSRRAGVLARGSITRCSFSFSVVMEMFTTAAWCAASSPSRSMSRVTRWFLVTMATGLRNSASTSRQRRVISSLRSTGW